MRRFGDFAQLGQLGSKRKQLLGPLDEESQQLNDGAALLHPSAAAPKHTEPWLAAA